jgi:hypothetical protein
MLAMLANSFLAAGLDPYLAISGSPGAAATSTQPRALARVGERLSFTGFILASARTKNVARQMTARTLYIHLYTISRDPSRGGGRRRGAPGQRARAELVDEAVAAGRQAVAGPGPFLTKTLPPTLAMGEGNYRPRLGAGNRPVRDAWSAAIVCRESAGANAHVVHAGKLCPTVTGGTSHAAVAARTRRAALLASILTQRRPQ